MKHAVFSPSSGFDHSVEVIDILDKMNNIPSILVLYTDGGPDHRLTLLSVQLALVALFLRLNLNILVATDQHLGTVISILWRE